MSLTPQGYAFQFGEYAGLILVTCIFLWLLLFSAQTRRGILLFCIFAFGQIGFTALVGLHFRTEDRVMQSILKNFVVEASEGASQMQQFRMDSLFDMTSGKGQLSIAELRELQIRAQSGKAKCLELNSDHIRSLADAERRIAATSSEAAANFRQGVESVQPASDQYMKLVQDYFTGIEQLTGFLINKQGQYVQTSSGVVFKTEEDSKAFNKQLDTIAKQADSIAQLEARFASSYQEVTHH